MRFPVVVTERRFYHGGVNLKKNISVTKTITTLNTLLCSTVAETGKDFFFKGVRRKHRN